MSQTTLKDLEWAHKPLGKAARIAIAAAGMVLSFSLLNLAGSVATGVWVLVVGGVALTATCVRAAWIPSRGRLITVMANLVAIPLLIQAI